VTARVLPWSLAALLFAGDSLAAPPTPSSIIVNSAKVCAVVQSHLRCSDLAKPDARLEDVNALGDVQKAASGPRAREYRSEWSGFSCVVQHGGAVWCWGDNSSAQLGAGLREAQSDAPVSMQGVSGVRELALSGYHGCALTAGSRVVCWGLNQGGETGGGTSYQPKVRDLATPTVVPDVENAIAIAVIHGSSCALTQSRDVFCWGASVSLEHSKMLQGARASEKPAKLGELHGMESIDGGDGVFCGIRKGDVVCWGNHFFLHPDQKYDPVSFGLKSAKKVRLGRHHGCALLTDGTVTCFGQRDSGALGRPLPETRGLEAPSPVLGLPKVVDLAAGDSITCAMTERQGTYCFGILPGDRKTPRPVRVRAFD
jgi:alpha-tubulin suppressor-like RCC1 family protein